MGQNMVCLRLQKNHAVGSTVHIYMVFFILTIIKVDFYQLVMSPIGCPILKP